MKIKQRIAAAAAALVCIINAVSGFTLVASAEDITPVAINEMNFPDDVFREYVSSLDPDADGYLTADEIAGITEIYIAYYGISDLTGIEYFTALAELYCNDNSLTNLDLSNNTALEALYCAYNSITSLDLSNNNALEYLSCPYNSLTRLDVSNCTALKELYCYNNALTSLDVSSNTALTSLYCIDNSLSSLDVSSNTALVKLSCGFNFLASLDVSNNTALELLYCDDNTYEIVLSEDGTFDLSTLPEGFDLSKATEWTNATVDGNVLTITDASTNITYSYDTGFEVVTFTLIPTDAIVGDITGDSAINLYDVIEIAKFMLGMRDFTEAEAAVADYNGDGTVNLYDAIAIAQYMMS